MSIYDSILDWSNDKSIFLRDALRRIISSTSLTQNDMDELIQLLKKECGEDAIAINGIPINNSHIPTKTNSTENYPRLISLSNPINICALYNQETLEFTRMGLTVIYGNNGSGKSSYARILRKLCWSRNPNVTLMKNVFDRSLNNQSVNLVIENNGVEENYSWSEGSPSNTVLNSIYVFDKDCADIYVNKENPSDYKPIGIDVLEKLVATFEEMSRTLDASVSTCTTQKPVMPASLINTKIAKWYNSIENCECEEIEKYIQFSDENLTRKQELFTYTNDHNISQNINALNNKKMRVFNYVKQLENFEANFSKQEIDAVIEIRENLENLNNTYRIASAELESLNTIEGFGSNPWRTMWEAARSFAISSNLTDGNNFPSLDSLEKCVLCQQELNEMAKNRLLSFKQFVMNDISTKLKAVERKNEEKILNYGSLKHPEIESLVELEQIIPNFNQHYRTFITAVNQTKSSIINYLKKGGIVKEEYHNISASVKSLLPLIDIEVDNNKQHLISKQILMDELYELEAMEFLFNNKTTILNYSVDNRKKSWVRVCKSKLSTTGISRKIGELMENQGVRLQHQEFVEHLSEFNKDLSSKIQITKTRTSQGNTYQRCGINGINEAIDTVLSEGEQKIIAISNFLAECTIDNRLNTIVFDDPVSSLDMDYKSYIAKKIVSLARNRQIIVFTHDLSFLRLLIDTHKEEITESCTIIGIDKYDGKTGIVTDEIPYLAKNTQERVDSIRRVLKEHDQLPINDAHGRNIKLDSARKRFRMLIERSVEEILSNKTYERFSMKINLKKDKLAGFIVTEESDVDLLLKLFGRYSISEHDGGSTSINQLPSKNDIEQDIYDYCRWKDSFNAKIKDFSRRGN